MDEQPQHQANTHDYTNNRQGYDRGHLFPSSYGFNDNDTISTYTMTNIVPQGKTFNGGSWKNMETCIRCVINKYCINNNEVLEGYVVTGAQPSRNKMLKGDRVNIPSMLWSAFCCYSNKRSM